MQDWKRFALDHLIYLALAAALAVAVMIGAEPARTPDDAGRAVRAPVPGEYRGPSVPQVIDRHNRRGGPHDVSPPDVLEPES